MSRSWLERVAPAPGVPPAGLAIRSLCGANAERTGWIEPLRVIYDHQLILIQDGEYAVDVEGRTHVLTADRFLIIPPLCWHTTTCRRTGLRRYAHFDWRPSDVRPDAPVMTFHPARPRRDCVRRAPRGVPSGVLHGRIASPAVAYELAERMRLMLLGDSAHERLAARAVLLELLIRLLDRGPREAVPRRGREGLAHRAREALDAHVVRPDPTAGIRALLARTGRSYEHLARLFRARYGLTPLGYVQSVRVERAKVLLRQTDWKVEAVARAVGYQDAVYFSKLFKRLTGRTPGSFRQAL